MPTKASVPAAGPTSSPDASTRTKPLAWTRSSGALSLGVLGVAFCALPFVAWIVSGHWVPEVVVFGLAAGLVGLVSQTR